MEYDYYPESEIPVKTKKFTVKKLFKWLVIALIAGLYLLIFYRIFATNTSPKLSKSYIWTDEGVSAYYTDGANFKVQNQQIKSITVTNGSGKDASAEYVVHNVITDDGYYRISNFMYNEATKELMITVRFNKGALENIRELYGLTDTPDASSSVFVLEGYKGHAEPTVDLSANSNRSSPKGLAIFDDSDFFYDYSYTSKKSNGYYFYRLVYTGVELDKYDTLVLAAYYAENVKLSTPLGAIAIYDSRVPVEYYTIKSALPAKARTDLKKAPYFIAVK